VLGQAIDDSNLTEKRSDYERLMLSMSCTSPPVSVDLETEAAFHKALSDVLSVVDMPFLDMNKREVNNE